MAINFTEEHNSGSSVETHDRAKEGHLEVMENLNRARKRFYWDRLHADVEKWCSECQAFRARKGRKIEQTKSVTGTNPEEMLSNGTPRLPCDILFWRPSDAPSSPNKNIEARL
ncbi:hypothetical protein AVEN_73700-1 [Araneus ventricosus]|uniref:Integrase zinc-binding domain-containing protein n=1 Tax=Araneus ventricosus TaxID=182803 RepID=A0A4Y2HR99_ARAVE|nr:hypothetical protein AVEN_73700-1 [Araneus ventricosus]